MSGMLASKQYLCAMVGPIGVLRAFLWGPTHHNRVEKWKQFCAEISEEGRLRTSEGHVVSRSMQMCSITKVALTLHTRTLPYFMSGHNHGSTRSVPCNDPPRWKPAILWRRPVGFLPTHHKKVYPRASFFREWTRRSRVFVIEPGFGRFATETSRWLVYLKWNP